MDRAFHHFGTARGGKQMTTTHFNENTQGRNMSRIARISLLASVLWAAGLAHAQLAIRSVTAASQAGAEVIRIETTEPLKQLPAGFAIQSPARIALDFAGVANATGKSTFELNQGNLRSANVVEAGGRTRVVFNLNQAANYETRVEGNALLVLLQPPVASTTSVVAGSVGSTFAEAVNTGERSLPLSDIDFRRGTEGAGRVIVNLANSQTGVDIRQVGKNLVVEFLKTSLPEGLRRRLDVSDFGTPVKLVSASQVGDRVRLQIESTGNWEHSAYQSDSQFVLEVREVKPQENKLAQGPNYTGEKLSLNFQNIEVRALLQVIADFTNFNIITSDTVTGNLTLRLKDVPWDQALDIVLQSRNLGMRKTGNVIRVAPRAELEAEELAQRENASKLETLEPLKTEVFKLNFAKAAEIAKVLNEDRGGASGGSSGTAGTTGTANQNRLLSSRGSVVADERTNQIFVTDVTSRLAVVTDFVKRIDAPKRQVMIQARIVEANEGFGRSLGVRLGGADLRGVRGGDAGYSVGGSNRLALGGSYDAISSTTGQTGNLMTNNNTSFLNLPAAIDPSINSSGASSQIAFSLFSSAANRFLNLELSALESDNRGKVISSPRLVTGDLSKSSIEQGERVSIVLRGSDTADDRTVNIDANLKLEVEPQITPSGAVLMKLKVAKNRLLNLTPTNVTLGVKEVNTDVMVENGGTIVIGGIFEQEDSSQVNKVPFLGDVPFFGHLFKSRTTNSVKTETLIFITPVIVDEVASR
jgi:type IV pilus assembly protein PilQ